MTVRRAQVRIDITGNATRNGRQLAGTFRTLGRAMQDIERGTRRLNRAVRTMSRIGDQSEQAARGVRRLASATRRLDRAMEGAHLGQQVQHLNAMAGAARRAERAQGNLARAQARSARAGRAQGRTGGGMGRGGVAAMTGFGGRGGMIGGRVSSVASGMGGGVAGLARAIPAIGAAMAIGAAVDLGLRAAAGAARAMGNEVAASVREAGALQEAMSSVEAVTNGSRGAMAALTDQARQLGATTSFTATQVASIQESLGRAGFTTSEIQGATAGALNLARGTGAGTGDAAELVATSIRSFGLSAGRGSAGDGTGGRSQGGVADVLAATTARSNVNFETLRDSLRYIAPVAAGAGQSIEQTSGLIGALGNVGITGSQAGTTLRTAFTRLAAPRGAGQTALEGLSLQGQTGGVSARDSQGNMRSLTDVLGDIREVFQQRRTMGEQGTGPAFGRADEARIVSEIFGQRAQSGVMALLGSLESVTALTGGLERTAGAAETMRMIMEDNLPGSITIAQSALAGLRERVGQELSPGVRGAVDELGGLARAVLEVFSASGQAQAGVRTMGTMFTDLTIGLGTGLAGILGAMGMEDEGVALMQGARRQRDQRNLDNQRMEMAAADQRRQRLGSEADTLGERFGSNLRGIRSGDRANVVAQRLQNTLGQLGGTQEQQDLVARLRGMGNQALTGDTLSGLQGADMGDTGGFASRVQNDLNRQFSSQISASTNSAQARIGLTQLVRSQASRDNTSRDLFENASNEDRRRAHLAGSRLAMAERAAGRDPGDVEVLAGEELARTSTDRATREQQLRIDQASEQLGGRGVLAGLSEGDVGTRGQLSPEMLQAGLALMGQSGEQQRAAVDAQAAATAENTRALGALPEALSQLPDQIGAAVAGALPNAGPPGSTPSAGAQVGTDG